MTAQAPVVEILSSTDQIVAQYSPFDQYFLSQISNIANVTVRPAKSAQGNYDKDSNGNILTVARTIGKDADLIVTVGGLVTAEAAAKLPTGGNNWNAGILSIMGNYPRKGSTLLSHRGNFLGGVDLNATLLNAARAAVLGVDNTKICLYFNSNAHLAQDELDHWNYYVGGLNLPSGHDQTRAYTAGQFATDFGKLAGMGAQAVVVSSDPFLASHAADLIAAAPNIPFCYPNEFYQPRFGSGDKLVGASLQNGYTSLANKATKYLQRLTGGTAQTYLGVDVQDASL
jgi:hypothetical protein